MSTVEDVRQVFQDFLAPDIKEIKAKLDSIQQVANYRFDAVDAKLQAQDLKIDARFSVLESKLQHLVESLDLDRRLKKLEAQRSEQSAA